MKILYLYAKKYFDTKMSIGRLRYAQALARQPDVDLWIWGDGWEGYDYQASLLDNINNSGYEPTQLWLYKAGDYIGVANVNLPKLIVMNEAYDKAQTLAEIKASAATQVVFHHENDYCYWRNFLPNCFHLPHSAIPYADLKRISERPINCLVTGNLNKKIYPLRRRMARLVHYGFLPGEIRQHPVRISAHRDRPFQLNDRSFQNERDRLFQI